MTNELMRANKVTIKVVDSKYVADFYRTHKFLTTVSAEETGWVEPQESTKSATRESFRQYVTDNAQSFGINWSPVDMRNKELVRKAKYETEDDIFEDALVMMLPKFRDMVDNCKYDITFGGVECDSIVPMTHTGSGKELSTIGIDNGKYRNSGNWAWATINLIMTFKYGKEECYASFEASLVSGQLKKVDLGIQKFNDRIKSEIINAGLATEEQLDPPKEAKPKKSKKEEIPTKEVVTEAKPKRKSNKKQEITTTGIANELREELAKPKRTRRRKAEVVAEEV